MSLDVGLRKHLLVGFIGIDSLALWLKSFTLARLDHTPCTWLFVHWLMSYLPFRLESPLSGFSTILLSGALGIPSMFAE